MDRSGGEGGNVESRPVFADPSGRRRKVLRFAGIGSMAVLAAFLVATVMAVTGGPQAPFTQWAVPQAPSPGAKHSGDQALTGGGDSRSGAPRHRAGPAAVRQAGPPLQASPPAPRHRGHGQPAQRQARPRRPPRRPPRRRLPRLLPPRRLPRLTGTATPTRTPRRRPGRRPDSWHRTPMTYRPLRPFPGIDLPADTIPDMRPVTGPSR